MRRPLLAPVAALALVLAGSQLGAAAAAHPRRARHGKDPARHLRPHAPRRIAASPTTTSTTTAPVSGPLVGTFDLVPGTYSAGAGAAGSYFRMIEPGGTLSDGPYFSNSSSAASNQTYTLLRPGSDGGLITGAFQAPPSPAFDSEGNALDARIIQPERFEGRNFSLSSASPDGQTDVSVPAPGIVASAGRLTGQLQAFDAEWNGQWFNQGSPKPGGASPGITQPLSGTYDASTHAFVLVWASTVIGGPFNGFTGYWHLQGTFAASA